MLLFAFFFFARGVDAFGVRACACASVRVCARVYVCVSQHVTVRRALGRNKNKQKNSRRGY